jgi:hypothetical protein
MDWKPAHSTLLAVVNMADPIEVTGAEDRCLCAENFSLKTLNIVVGL